MPLDGSVWKQDARDRDDFMTSITKRSFFSEFSFLRLLCYATVANFLTLHLGLVHIGHISDFGLSICVLANYMKFIKSSRFLRQLLNFATLKVRTIHPILNILLHIVAIN